MLKNINYLWCLIAVVFILTSCGANKEVHQERLILQDIETQAGKKIQAPINVIKKDDLLSITVFSDNKEATEIYNQAQAITSGVGGGTSGTPNPGRGYQVDTNGEIYFHSIGLIRVEGLTKTQLADLLTERLKTYLQNPYVVVRFSNSRVTVLGEVAKPGSINMPDQKLSILDAIGLSGDLTIFARRDNILIVREKDGIKEIGRLDIRKSDIYDSPFFYLQQNDMVYVEPTRKKPTGNEQVLMRNIAIGTSMLSVLTFLTTILIR